MLTWRWGAAWIIEFGEGATLRWCVDNILRPKSVWLLDWWVLSAIWGFFFAVRIYLFDGIRSCSRTYVCHLLNHICCSPSIRFHFQADNILLNLNANRDNENTCSPLSPSPCPSDFKFWHFSASNWYLLFMKRYHSTQLIIKLYIDAARDKENRKKNTDTDNCFVMAQEPIQWKRQASLATISEATNETREVEPKKSRPYN